MLRFTAFLSMPTMLGLALVADFIIVLMGDKWTDSVHLLRLLAVSGAFLPIHTLYQNLFISHGRSDYYLWCTVAQIVLQVSVIVIFSTWGIQTMVTAYAAMLILWTGVWQYLARREMGLRFRDMLKDVVPFLLSALASILIAWFLTRNIGSVIVQIVLRIVIVAALYIGVMKLARVKIFEECTSFLMRRLVR